MKSVDPNELLGDEEFDKKTGGSVLCIVGFVGTVGFCGYRVIQEVAAGEALRAVGLTCLGILLGAYYLYLFLISIGVEVFGD